jgi:hypothetical protein
MPREVVLRTRVESTTAALVRVHAERARMSTSKWIADVVRRELASVGAADALSLRSYEMLITVGYMLRSLMIDAIGEEQAQTAIQEASEQAADEASDELRRAMELG